jgi:hypothetical protein
MYLNLSLLEVPNVQTIVVAGGASDTATFRDDL